MECFFFVRTRYPDENSKTDHFFFRLNIQTCHRVLFQYGNGMNIVSTSTVKYFLLKNRKA